MGSLRKAETPLPIAGEQGRACGRLAGTRPPWSRGGTVALGKGHQSSPVPLTRSGWGPAWGLETGLRKPPPSPFLGELGKWFPCPRQAGECPGRGPCPGLQARPNTDHRHGHGRGRVSRRLGGKPRALRVPQDSSEPAFQDRGPEVASNRETPGKNEALGSMARKTEPGKNKTRARSWPCLECRLLLVINGAGGGGGASGTVINGVVSEPYVSVIKPGNGPRSTSSPPNHFFSLGPLLLQSCLMQNCSGVLSIL